MKKLLAITMISMFVLGSCGTADDCENDPNPEECKQGGGNGPVIDREN